MLWAFLVSGKSDASSYSDLLPSIPPVYGGCTAYPTPDPHGPSKAICSPLRTQPPPSTIRLTLHPTSSTQ